MSDLHFEFHQDGGRAFVRALDPSGIDALVVAGDLATAPMLRGSLALLAEKYERVVFVTGNHEMYDSSPPEVAEIRKWVIDNAPCVTWLDKELLKFRGDPSTDIVGCTLWFPESQDARQNEDGLNDFRAIRDFKPWVYEEAKRDAEYLVDNVLEGDVVITHHLPTIQSVPERYRGDPMNAFFLHDVEEKVIRRRKPKLWIHGHTHDSCDYVIGETRVVCNPYGYHGRQVNPKFDPKFVVDV